MIIAENGFNANIDVLKTSQKMQNNVVDIIA
jgi:flagellar basal body rod protein FlgC